MLEELACGNLEGEFCSLQCERDYVIRWYNGLSATAQFQLWRQGVLRPRNKRVNIRPERKRRLRQDLAQLTSEERETLQAAKDSRMRLRLWRTDEIDMGGWTYLASDTDGS